MAAKRLKGALTLEGVTVFALALPSAGGDALELETAHPSLTIGVEFGLDGRSYRVVKINRATGDLWARAECVATDAPSSTDHSFAEDGHHDQPDPDPESTARREDDRHQWEDGPLDPDNGDLGEA